MIADGTPAIPEPTCLMLVERMNGTVCWMRPDAEISQADAELGISDRHSASTTIGSNHKDGWNGCNVGLLDGGVTFISETSDTKDVTAFQELIRGTAKERL